MREQGLRFWKLSNSFKCNQPTSEIKIFLCLLKKKFYFFIFANRCCSTTFVAFSWQQNQPDQNFFHFIDFFFFVKAWQTTRLSVILSGDHFIRLHPSSVRPFSSRLTLLFRIYSLIIIILISRIKASSILQQRKSS